MASDSRSERIDRSRLEDLQNQRPDIRQRFDSYLERRKAYEQVRGRDQSPAGAPTRQTPRRTARSRWA